ncbi:MAG: dTDP-4-dehydrorhamnose 3,5-epimerase [bacterium]
MIVEQTELPGVLILEPRVFGDSRGFFFENWRCDGYSSLGINDAFVQDNVSRSSRGVLRGLHVQHPGEQGKLVSVLHGDVFDVAVDVRRGSPWFGQSIGVRLSDVNHRQVYIPPGFAHGFQVLSESALFLYKCTAYYQADTETSILWNDPSLAIRWPLPEPTLSEKDRLAVPLRDVSPDRLPKYL